MKSNLSTSLFVMGVIFCVCLIASNLLEMKVIDAGPLTLTGGLLIFPISYIINDCISEVWGFKKARFIIWFGFLMNLFVVLVGWLATLLPSPGYWEGAPHFNFIFAFAPRMVVASMIAFLVGSFANAYVMSRMKIRDGGKRFGLRAICSTIVGESLDSVIFFPFAFGGVMAWTELVKVMLIQVVLKTLYEMLVLPFTSKIVRWVKPNDNADVFDTDVSYNPLRIKQI